MLGAGRVPTRGGAGQRAGGPPRKPEGRLEKPQEAGGWLVGGTLGRALGPEPCPPRSQLCAHSPKAPWGQIRPTCPLSSPARDLPFQGIGLGPDWGWQDLGELFHPQTPCTQLLPPPNAAPAGFRGSGRLWGQVPGQCPGETRGQVERGWAPAPPPPGVAMAAASAELVSSPPRPTLVPGTCPLCGSFM